MLSARFGFKISQSIPDRSLQNSQIYTQPIMHGMEIYIQTFKDVMRHMVGKAFPVMYVVDLDDLQFRRFGSLWAPETPGEFEYWCTGSVKGMKSERSSVLMVIDRYLRLEGPRKLSKGFGLHANGTRARTLDHYNSHPSRTDQSEAKTRFKDVNERCLSSFPAS